MVICRTTFFLRPASRIVTNVLYSFAAEMTNDIAAPEDISNLIITLSTSERVAVDHVYTNLGELRYSSERITALYMAERALFTSNLKVIRRINLVVTHRHPGHTVTLSAGHLANIPGFTIQTIRPLASVTGMDRPDLYIVLKVGSPVRLTKDVCLFGNNATRTNFTRGMRFVVRRIEDDSLVVVSIANGDVHHQVRLKKIMTYCVDRRQPKNVFLRYQYPIIVLYASHSAHLTQEQLPIHFNLIN
ncbi:hypothetical protein PTTG_26092 [Puccinia triticina 1-1 BBBD Race 1]|uniref:Uncharacterized protein n=1 Tax=Puccinia triticina (isolate 1-1 / race 1 (BBBD)) TaxID=630390 RepID=A0A180GZ04_PUCT1|nr:hypothetical protein PTTG_26092 [Puccinia triticina 1-1 BBBD Race 1]WAR63618.1 hypothetical protein PtB15_17B218 [Puccinia triticina]